MSHLNPSADGPIVPRGRTVNERLRSLMEHPLYGDPTDRRLYDHVSELYRKAYPGGEHADASGRTMRTAPVIEPEDVAPFDPRGGTVHVCEHTRDGHRVCAYERAAPGRGDKGHNVERRPHVLGELTGHEKRAYVNSKGNAECVEFIRQSLDAPHSSKWREGAKVHRIAPGEPDPVARGTAIATFVDGEYPQTGSTGKHAAIYLGQSAEGIQVLDQWKGQGHVEKRTIPWRPRRPGLSNDGNAFSVIEW